MGSILLFLIETKLGRGIAITGAVVIGLGIGWATFSIHYYNKGYSAALANIAAQNERAKHNADQAISDVQACFNSGGTWNASNGRCVQ